MTCIGLGHLPIVLHLRGAINTRLAYRYGRIEREDKGALSRVGHLAEEIAYGW